MKHRICFFVIIAVQLNEKCKDLIGSVFTLAVENVVDDSRCRKQPYVQLNVGYLEALVQ
jgi:hypothetical protein